MTYSLRSHRRIRVMARDTKLGAEEITRDIPNSEESLRNLDEVGNRVGAEVKPGDILVGKVTPKSETSRVLKKIIKIYLREKATDRDSSLKLPSEVQAL